MTPDLRHDPPLNPDPLPSSAPSPLQLALFGVSTLGYAIGLSLLLLAIASVGGYRWSGVGPIILLFVATTIIVLVCRLPFFLRRAPHASGSSQTSPTMRTSIRRRLLVSHLVTVTASTFVYATGGFFLLLALLWVNGYRWYDASSLITQFAGITIFVLVQIGLITLCGLIVARIASGYVSRRLIAQVTEMELATNEFSRGNLERRVPILTEDELGRLAERFNLLAQRLYDLDKQRRSFVANISHDLRTPIAIIQGHVDAQLESAAEPTVSTDESFRAIAHEVQTLKKLIEDLFTLSRLEEAALPVASQPVDIGRLAEAAVSGLRPYALKTARVSLHARVADGVSEVMGDETRITQIINNLAHNAIRHTPAGGVVIISVDEVDGGREVEVVVRDTGVGIAEHDLPRIFDRFYRGESTREGGTGLGLSIVSQLVEIQGGTVHAESVVNEGTAISFRLPAATTQAREALTGKQLAEFGKR